jgi:hypothetical protein
MVVAVAGCFLRVCTKRWLQSATEAG